jgi:hypothetical protein
MKQRDVKIGQVYLTRVTPHVVWQEVIVVDQVQDSSSGRTKFRVRRNLPGSSVLPKYRTASALHERTVRPPQTAASDQEAIKPVD